LVRKSEGKRQYEKHGRRWNDNRYIKMDLTKIGHESTEWIHTAQDNVQWRVIVNTLINLRVS